MKIDIDSRLNLREIEKMSEIDANMLKDKTFKDIVPNYASMVKGIKEERKNLRKKH
jgi:hypothetical protein